MTTAEPEPVRRLQELLDRLEAARAELERAEDPQRAVEILQELSDLAKEVQAEIDQARREAPDA